MAYTPIYGFCFCIYDTYEPNTNVLTDNVPTFIDKYINQLKQSTNKNFANIQDMLNDPGFEKEELPGIFDEEPLWGNLFTQDEEPDVYSSFESLDKQRITIERMFCVWLEHAQPYDAPYEDKQSFIKAVKEELDKYEITPCLPDNFDIESHIGEMSTCVLY